MFNTSFRLIQLKIATTKLWSCFRCKWKSSMVNQIIKLYVQENQTHRKQIWERTEVKCRTNQQNVLMKLAPSWQGNYQTFSSSRFCISLLSTPICFSCNYSVSSLEDFKTVDLLLSMKFKNATRIWEQAEENWRLEM